MFKLHAKSVAIGLAVGLLISGVPALADEVQEYILHKVDYKIEVNGIEYTDEEFPALNHNGTTYVPLRAMGKLFGAIVNWNSEKGKVEIGQGSKATSTTASTAQPVPTPIAPQSSNRIVPSDDNSQKFEVPEKDNFNIIISQSTGKKYYSMMYIVDVLETEAFFEDYVKNPPMINLYNRKSKNLLYKNIPIVLVESRIFICEDDYTQKIKPLLK